MGMSSAPPSPFHSAAFPSSSFGGLQTGALKSGQISSLWMNSNISSGGYDRLRADQAEDEEVAAEDEEDMGVIETYSNYMPAKLKVSI